jgi:cbb3-type cytochrome oxidase subunit 3
VYYLYQKKKKTEAAGASLAILRVQEKTHM